ncbi:hypothetical protein [Roseofilum capinflatum]|uniref:Uncharacterized protein n=1 Tax=Roseofilum capinflatum BLCC-M114 TaxID=3022440 RepID=A0ABT7B7C3_9CYAN|nr:hypothetical protein [Roseofilum capinflatum]MDJ1175031.1 hypothetical protein [Roseofilum capinflatum BLCC-M114]
MGGVNDYCRRLMGNAIAVSAMIWSINQLIGFAIRGYPLSATQDHVIEGNPVSKHVYPPNRLR